MNNPRCKPKVEANSLTKTLKGLNSVIFSSFRAVELGTI